MKKYISLIIILMSIPMLAQNYSLDHTFGTSGSIVTNNNIKPSNGFFEGGKYYFFGNQNRVARYNYDGTIDYTYGNYGAFVISVEGKWPYIKDVIMHNGQIYGFGRVDSPTEMSNALIFRLTPDGLPDPTFGVNGIVEFDLGTKETFNGIMVNPDGTIYATGTKEPTSYVGEILLCKFLPNGMLDLNFNLTGYKLFPYGQFSKGISLFPYGNGILMGNWTRADGYSQIFLQKINEAGEVMTDFGNNGALLITVDIFGSGSSDNFLKMQLVDEEIYCTFYHGTSFNSQGYQLQSYSLAAPNIKIIDVGIYIDSYFKVLDDGKIMIARGVLCPHPSCNSTSYILKRYNADGTLDSTFHNSGTFTYNFLTSPSSIEGSTFFYLHPDSKILLAGVTSQSSSSTLSMLRIGDSTLLSDTQYTIGTSFKIFPNPARDVLNISSYSNRIIKKILITDLLGKVVNFEVINENQVDISHLQQGMYICTVIAEDGEAGRIKFIKS